MKRIRDWLQTVRHIEVSSVSARHAVDPTLAKIAERVKIALTKKNVLTVCT